MMEDFSGLALPPLFGGHILEAELETGGVELGPSGTELLDSDGAPSGPAQDGEDERRELDHSKYHALSKRCREIEQVNEKILGRLHQVQRLTRRLRKERKFLMKTLDSYGDDYRTAQLTITLEDEGKAGLDSAVGADEDSSSPTFPHQSAAGPKKKRHRVPKDRKRDAQMESEHPVTAQDSSVLADPRPDEHTEAH
ncbi:TCF3 fusion partner-like [Sinocyclocheilus rhinocerous]|uniref:TCF3 fusion partner-like n=1 Tax=Sinocyclocheilus rhinocerous TaxID=307959 RepID=A0A673K195_9TELE|nr:PREDICTED: TCF3 fusion partner-like [Sinocyclocheilus rhinocerous]XP_016375056.1 PREDICTED: TCF3 fusion partner-like [Sinocyclocheilus rhinocerous]XP_016375057.1 PREDICTED: TCF3 fusion partner-like [Sinocyclocheilus rhinocerous]XP_016375058.1 PREDICTED: TCF3 fusion partner-like [Sinocyclocheilus rhinocerous]